jgi:hypothetical protein
MGHVMKNRKLQAGLTAIEFLIGAAFLSSLLMGSSLLYVVYHCEMKF